MKPNYLQACALVILTAGAAFASDHHLAVQIVDALNAVYGVHAGFRANHAKGIVAEGTFKPTAEAAELSKASLFAWGTVPITVRFSDAGGDPNVADGSVALPHGMAIKYHLPGGGETDMVLLSLK